MQITRSQTIGAFISSRKHDNFFIIFCPLIALLIIAAFCVPRFQTGLFLYNPDTPTWLIIGSNFLTHSHIMLVFLRSHGNSNVFKRFPLRFSLIPMFMLGAMWASPVLFAATGFIAVYWDEWHSLMQTFGFGRIYDAKLGNDVSTGRKLDMGLCFVLGLLPHVILLTFIPEAVRTEGLQAYLDLEPQHAAKYGHYFFALRIPLISFGITYILFYIWSYQKLIKNGYKYSSAKFTLFAATGISSSLMASLYTVADAAYFGNIYHAIQYYFIVYISEGSLISGKFGISKENKKGILMFYCFVVLSGCLLFAIVRSKTEGLGLFGAFWVMTSLLHFWYDGFIWSVRKQHI
jgi:hypothetical protein